MNVMQVDLRRDRAAMVMICQRAGLKARSWKPGWTCSSLSSAHQISASAFFAPGCADFGRAASTFAVL
jgi:hypothetical protein